VLIVEEAEETTIEVELLVGVGVDGWGAAKVVEYCRSLGYFTHTSLYCGPYPD
jgi:hypothetical protein